MGGAWYKVPGDNQFEQDEDLLEEEEGDGSDDLETSGEDNLNSWHKEEDNTDPLLGELDPTIEQIDMQGDHLDATLGNLTEESAKEDGDRGEMSPPEEISAVNNQQQVESMLEMLLEDQLQNIDCSTGTETVNNEQDERDRPVVTKKQRDPESDKHKNERRRKTATRVGQRTKTPLDQRRAPGKQHDKVKAGSANNSQNRSNQSDDMIWPP